MFIFACLIVEIIDLSVSYYIGLFKCEKLKEVFNPSFFERTKVDTERYISGSIVTIGKHTGR